MVLAAFAALIGVLAVRRIWLRARRRSRSFGAVGVAAAVSLPGADRLDVVPTLAGVAVAALALTAMAALSSAAPPRGTAAAAGLAPSPGVDTGAGASRVPRRGRGRRRFLVAGAGAAALAAVAGGLGRLLLGRFSVASSRAQVRLPAPAVPAPARPAGSGPADQRADAVLHFQRQLLPRRHRPGAAAGGAGKLDAADRRHGRHGARDHASPSCCGCR